MIINKYLYTHMRVQVSINCGVTSFLTRSIGVLTTRCWNISLICRSVSWISPIRDIVHTTARELKYEITDHIRPLCIDILTKLLSFYFVNTFWQITLCSFDKVSNPFKVFCNIPVEWISDLYNYWQIVT